MVYTDIISLEEAKNYLRIDDDLTEDDNSIIRMIEASLRYIEKYTDVIFYDTVDLILNVGFTDESEIPQDLLEVAFEMIDLYYYGEKDGKPIQKKLSSLSMDTLNIHKRFWL